jgi:tetratricopeptide (TPR) repeat protein
MRHPSLGGYLFRGMLGTGEKELGFPFITPFQSCYKWGALKASEPNPGRDRAAPARGGSPEKDPQLPAHATPITRRRLWVFRLCAIILSPLVVLGSLELVLRLTGYGYPTSFFVRTRLQGADFYVSNEKFSHQFFPAAMARSLLPVKLAVSKPPNTYRIFVFGESAANGDPEPSYGMGRYLEVLLRERFPGTEFEVVCVAITAIDSNVVLPIARECAGCQGDLWLIYMGNNEMVGPFGAETVIGPRAPHRALVRAILAVKSTRIGQLLDALWQKLKRPSSGRRAWGGMQMFTESRLPHDSPARLRAYANFRANLEDIVRAGRRAGVPVVLSTVAVNLKDCAPFASIHRAGLNDKELASWNTTFEQGVALERAGSYQAALSCYQKAANLDSHYAELQFRMGRCDFALTNQPQAREHFQLARDYDALAFRADTTINQSITTAAARHESDGVYLVDAAAAAAQSSPAGIPGAELFYEHVHFNFEGNYLLARSFAEGFRKLLPQSITVRDKGSWASAQSCERCLAVTVWDRQRVWQPIFNRISFPPFTGQLDHEAFFKSCEVKLNEAKAQLSSQTPEQARRIYQQALAAAPEDVLLHGNFEKFLEAGGDLTNAIAECQRVCELAPYLPAPYYNQGTMLVRQGKLREAEQCFAQAVAARSDFAPAYNELGLLFAGQQQTAKARASFTRALRTDPESADTHLNLGYFEQCQGNLDQAMAQYEEAARLQPNGPADYFTRAVRLAASHRSAEAIEVFQVLLQKVPALWQARCLLGLELAAAGSTREAQEQFAEALRYRPDSAWMLPQTVGSYNGMSN